MSKSPSPKRKKIEKLGKNLCNTGSLFGVFEYDPKEMGDKVNEIIEVLNSERLNGKKD